MRVFPPPPGWQPAPARGEHWGGRSEIKFRFDPARLLSALERWVRYTQAGGAWRA